MNKAFIAVLGVLTCFFGGCFSSKPNDIEAFKKPYQVNVTADKYILEPADEIQVSCPAIPELNGIQQRIRPDGKVSYLHFGEVEVAGKTPSEIAAILRQKAVGLYPMIGENPIDIRVAVYQSAVYYVLGQVDKPGPKPYTGRDSALRAIAEANPTVMAWGDRIQVIHMPENPAEPSKIFELKWDPMVAHGDASRDVLLSKGDIIYVPPTILAGIALKMEEFLTPIGRAFSTAYLVREVGSPTNSH